MRVNHYRDLNIDAIDILSDLNIYSSFDQLEEKIKIIQETLNHYSGRDENTLFKLDSKDQLEAPIR